MAKHRNISEDAFEFIKCRCLYCRKILPHNKLFCNNECRDLYFEKTNEIRIGAWTKKSKRRLEVSDILNEENMKAMVEETERNIDKKINKLKR